MGENLTHLRRLSFAPVDSCLPYNFAFALFTPQNQLVTVNNPRQGGAYVTVWEGQELSETRSSLVSTDPVSAAGLSPDGQVLGVGSIEGEVNLVNLNDLQRQSGQKCHDMIVKSLCFTSDSQKVFSVATDFSFSFLGWQSSAWWVF